MGARLGIAGPTLGTYERMEYPVPMRVREALVDQYGVDPQDVGMVVSAVSLSRDVEAFMSLAFNLALDALQNPSATPEERDNATKVLAAYRDIKAKPA